MHIHHVMSELGLKFIMSSTPNSSENCGGLCFWCQAPATCHGTYEGHTGYACDECCGHGCEDGWCEPTESDATPSE